MAQKNGVQRLADSDFTRAKNRTASHSKRALAAPARRLLPPPLPPLPPALPPAARRLVCQRTPALVHANRILNRSISSVCVSRCAQGQRPACCTSSRPAGLRLSASAGAVIALQVYVYTKCSRLGLETTTHAKVSALARRTHGKNKKRHRPAKARSAQLPIKRREITFVSG